MSVVTVAPPVVAAAAADISGIGAAIEEASIVAAAPTTGVVAPAADSVSARLAALFNGHAQTYQAVSAQAGVFHQDFVNTLTASDTAYTEAETTNSTTLRPHGVPSLLHLPGDLAPRLGTGLGGVGKWAPGTYLREFITNQKAYLHTIIQSLQNSFNDFWKNAKQIPANLKHAFELLKGGDISGAIYAFQSSFRNLFVDGLIWDGVPFAGPWMGHFTGALADLMPIWRIPGQMMQNLADVLKPVGFGYAGNLVQHVADGFNNFLNGFTIQFDYFTGKLVMGTPLALLYDFMGPGFLANQQLRASLQAVYDAVKNGHPLQALKPLVAMPFKMTQQFFFGQGETWPIYGPITYGESIHVAGLFAGLAPGRGVPGGTPTGGLLAALLDFVPPGLRPHLLYNDTWNPFAPYPAPPHSGFTPAPGNTGLLIPATGGNSSQLRGDAQLVLPTSALPVDSQRTPTHPLYTAA
jgi:PE family